MKIKEQTRTQQVLAVMKFLVYMSIVWFFLKLAGVSFSILVWLLKNEPVQSMVFIPDWFELRLTNPGFFIITVLLTILIGALKISVWIMVLRLLKKIEIKNPFNTDVTRKLEQISYILFTIWVALVSAHGFFAWLGDKAGELNDSWNHGPYLFIAGLVFIISQVFKRGVELQSENDLTV